MAMGVTLKKGDIITIDGSNGQVLKGTVPMLQPELSGDFAAIMQWADKIRRMAVRTNAETPADARMARSFGAEGIGLCRTEHMFFDDDRIVRHARNDPGRHRKGQAHRARQATADAALGLSRTVRDHGRPAGDDSPARSALARIPAQDGSGNRRGRRFDECLGREAAAAHRSPARVQSDARPSRLPAGGLLSGNRRDAGAGDLRGGRRGGEEDWRSRGAGGDGAAGRAGGRARLCEGAHRPGGQERHAGIRDDDRLSRRHHDRIAARGDPRSCRSPRRQNSSPSAPTT